jgi:hypothetical protein
MYVLMVLYHTVEPLILASYVMVRAGRNTKIGITKC